MTRVVRGGWLPSVVAALISLFLINCGGGGGSPSRSLPPPGPPNLSITTTTLPQAETGISYFATLQASGGTGSITWSISSGNLPSGLTLTSATGEISGRPDADGTFSFSVRVQDSALSPQAATKNFSITVVIGLVITTESLPDAIVNEPYSHTLEATGGTPPYTWSWELISGATPPGINLSPEGVVSGISSVATGGTFRVRVDDSGNGLVTRDLSLAVLSPLVIEIDSLPAGNIGVFYDSGFTASGGQGSRLVWSITSGRLPEGLILDSNRILGTPTEIGTFDFTLLVEGGPQTVPTEKNLSLFIDNQPVITIESLPDGVTNEPYSGTLSAVGGITPYAWVLSEGRLPNGLQLNPTTGEISGVPTEEWFNPALTIRLEDSSTPPLTVTAFVRITIRGPLGLNVGAFLPGAIQDEFYQQIIDGFGGRPPYTLQVTSGSLPDGLSLIPRTETSFKIEGKPTTLGKFPFALELVDSSTPPAIVREDHSITVVEKLIIATESLPEGLEGSPYSGTLSGTGGTLPYEWRISTLPEGLVLGSATGEISGSPLRSVDGTVRVFLRDSGSDPATMPLQQVSKLVPLKITPLLLLTTTQLSQAVANSDYKFLPGVRGGVEPYTWSIATGSLPPGLMLNPETGEISGTLPGPGGHDFTLRVEDSGTTFPQTDEQSFSLEIVDALPRNESTSTATPLSNGTYRVSISPYADPADVPAPDNDYYELTANAGSKVIVEIFAERLTPSSPMDPVIELVADDGTVLQTCRDTSDDFHFPPLVRDITPNEFDDACKNDDNLEMLTLDSKLEFKVPGNPGDIGTFFVRVLDFRGDARPDFVYEIKISGAN